MPRTDTPAHIPFEPTVPSSRTREVCATLRSLVHLELDAIEAYRAAIGKLDDVECKIHLDQFMHDHERHVEELSAALIVLGETPPTGGDARRIVTKGKVILGDLLGDEWIMKAVASNEDATGEAYELALERTDLSPTARSVIERALADERRHAAWIELRLSRSFGR
jgi:rubrerythrin